MQKHPALQRGFDDKGWLQSYHSFSFDNYYNPEKMGYRELRVINEETLQGGKGFDSHSHKEIEIATLVLTGVLQHEDSLGNVAVIKTGDLHLLTAGTGIIHQERNLSQTEPAHYVQFWFMPEQHNLSPTYEQRHFSDALKWGQWCLLMSKNGRGGSIKAPQNLDLYATLLDDKDELSFNGFIERHYWLQILKGKFKIGNEELSAGDALAMNNVLEFVVICLEQGELLLFDLA